MSRAQLSALTVFLSTLLWSPAGASNEIHVVTSIKPVHSLVSGVMMGVAVPHLIVRGGNSPHSFSLKPSDARALQNAQLVFWIGEGMETFLTAPLKNLARNSEIIELSEANGLTRLKFREGGPWAAHDHDNHVDDREHDHKGHAESEDHNAMQEHGEIDMHLWLDTVNAKAMVHVIVKALERTDPDRANLYKTNGQKLLARLESLTSELKKLLAPIRNKPFIVFHDSFQYLENRYDLMAAGSVTVSPDIQPGAERLRKIREKLRATGARCVFTEPQFQSNLVKIIVEGTKANTGVLDPLGTHIADGPDLYFDMMKANAKSLTQCLSKSS